MTLEPAKNLLTYKETASFLAMKLPTLYSKVCRHEVPHVRLSGRCVRFDPDELQAWLDARRVPVANKIPIAE